MGVVEKCLAVRLGNPFLLTVLACVAFASAGCRSIPYSEKRPSKSKRQEQQSESLLQQRARAHAHYAAAVIQDINGEQAAANAEYLKAATEDSGDETLVLDVSRRLLQAKDFNNALGIVAQSAERADASGSIHARLGMIYAQLGRTQEALAANKKAIEKSPGLLAPYQNLFVGHMQAGREDAAWNILSQAASQAGAGPEFLVGLAEMYSNFGTQYPARRDQAKAESIKSLERAAGFKSLNSTLLLLLAENLNNAGDTTNAAKLYNQLLKNLPPVPGLRERVHAKLSEIYLRSDDHARAVEQLQALVREDPTNPQAWYFLGALAMDDRKPAEAVEHFQRTLILNPDFEQAYYDLANAQISSDKPGDALVTLEKTRRKFRQTFVREFLAGVAYAHQKAYTEALQRFTAAEVVARATDTNRLNHYFYFQLGAAFERNGQFEEAQKAFNKCLELQPDFGSALNYLGYMWAERGENLDKARALIEKALKAEPKNAAYLDSLAWVLFKQGSHKEALVEILKALELTEEPDATLYDHLGEIQAAHGRMDEAEKAWRRSIEIEDNPAVRKKLETTVSK